MSALSGSLAATASGLRLLGGAGIQMRRQQAGRAAAAQRGQPAQAAARRLASAPRDVAASFATAGEVGFLVFGYGYGSKLNHPATAGFSPWFHLPGLHLGYLFLSHSHMKGKSLWSAFSMEVTMSFSSLVYRWFGNWKTDS